MPTHFSLKSHHTRPDDEDDPGAAPLPVEPDQGPAAPLVPQEHEGDGAPDAEV